MSEEIFPLVNQSGEVIGKAPRSVCHNGSKLLHPVVHLHIFNSKGELFLQKRSAMKDVQPNKWDTAVAGHIDLGETVETAVLREAREELGIENVEPVFIRKYIIETPTERELSYCYYVTYEGAITLDCTEVADGRYWRIEEIEQNMNKNIFTINFESDFETIIKDIVRKE